VLPLNLLEREIDMFTGRRVTQVNDYDVNLTPDGEETWEMENSGDIDDLVEEYIEGAEEADDLLDDMEKIRLRDFALWLKNR
jgi:hypothetical protein